MNIQGTVVTAIKNFIVSSAPTLIPVENILEDLNGDLAMDDNDEGPLPHPIPCVLIQCNVKQQQPPLTGNWDCGLVIVVRAMAEDTTRAQFLAMTSEIFGFFNSSTRDADMSAATDNFTCLFSQLTGQETSVNGRKWVSQLQIDGNFCESDV